MKLSFKQSQQHVQTGTRKLKVLLVENDQQKADIFIEALDTSHYLIHHEKASSLSLLQLVEAQQPDIIILDVESPDRDVLDSLTIISNSNPKPIVMFSDQGDTEAINQLVRSGVTAYICGGVDPDRVGTILDTALARFGEYQKLKNELSDTKQKLTNQKLIEQAKIWFMETKQITEKEAYHAIRKMAMDNGQKIDDVAKNILSLAKVLESN